MYAADCDSNVDLHNVRSKTTFNTLEVNIFNKIWFPYLNNHHSILLNCNFKLRKPDKIAEKLCCENDFILC